MTQTNDRHLEQQHYFVPAKNKWLGPAGSTCTVPVQQPRLRYCTLPFVQVQHTTDGRKEERELERRMSPSFLPSFLGSIHSSFLFHFARRRYHKSFVVSVSRNKQTNKQKSHCCKTKVVLYDNQIISSKDPNSVSY